MLIVLGMVLVLAVVFGSGVHLGVHLSKRIVKSKDTFVEEDDRQKKRGPKQTCRLSCNTRRRVEPDMSVKHPH